MRFVRFNALAVDFGVLPKHPGPASIQEFLESKLQLEVAKLRSVQIHSTRGIAYVGLPDDLPAAAIADRHHLKHEMAHASNLYRIPVLLADDDAVDVRVYDLPPEVPNDAIAAQLRQYGKVLAVTEEVWKHFFPGVKSGVRVVRMLVSQPIPRHIAIHGTTLVAHVRHPGQARKDPVEEAATLPAPAPTVADQRDHEKNKKVAPTSTPAATTAVKLSGSEQNNRCCQVRGANQPEKGPSSEGEENTTQAEEKEDEDFTVVRRKFKRQKSNESAAAEQKKRLFFVARGEVSSSDSDLDDKLMNEMTYQQIVDSGNFSRWAELHRRKYEAKQRETEHAM